MTEPLPPFACYRHVTARDGFEVVYIASDPQGLEVRGETCAVEAGHPFVVAYSITLDRAWRTRTATIRGQWPSGRKETVLAGDAAGSWTVDGRPAEELDGCLDVDLESSAFTNAFPVNRLRLAAGERAETPAAYVRAADLRVERLEQSYERLAGDSEDDQRYAYSAPIFDFACELRYDAAGLPRDYPGLAARAA